MKTPFFDPGKGSFEKAKKFYIQYKKKKKSYFVRSMFTQQNI